MNMLEFLHLRQSVICKALATLEIVIKENPDQKFLSKEEVDVIPKVVEQEQLKLCTYEKDLNK